MGGGPLPHLPACHQLTTLLPGFNNITSSSQEYSYIKDNGLYSQRNNYEFKTKIIVRCVYILFSYAEYIVYKKSHKVYYSTNQTNCYVLLLFCVCLPWLLLLFVLSSLSHTHSLFCFQLLLPSSYTSFFQIGTFAFNSSIK